MYAGGTVLEDYAVARAEPDLKTLSDRAPRVAHLRIRSTIEDIPIEDVVNANEVLVRAGEVIPVDGVITSANALIDESALTSEPIPVHRHAGEPARSGTLNAGETFELRATATAGESTYAGIVRMVTAAQTTKAPFIRLEALAHTHTVMFDKTGTLTVGGARLVAVEAAPGESADDVLRLAGSLEQASQHVVAKAIVASALAKGLKLEMPEDVHETMGSGVEGRIGGRAVVAGSHQMVYGPHKPEEWAVRALRRASWRSALSVFVSVDGHPIGALLLGDELRRETPRAIQSLRRAGVERIVMVTGDRADAAETIGSALDLDSGSVPARPLPGRLAAMCGNPGERGRPGLAPAWRLLEIDLPSLRTGHRDRQ